MTLVDEMKSIILTHQTLAPRIEHVTELINIYEGDLLRYVEQALEAQLKTQALQQARHRIAPINLLTKIVDKLSPIYQPGPARRIVEGTGTDADQELLDWYAREMSVDTYMADFVRMVSLCKSAVIYPFAHLQAPRLRVTQNDRFFVCSSDKVDPMRVTDYVTFTGCEDGTVDFTLWTDERHLLFNSKEEIDTATMVGMNNPEGVNPYGVLPIVYRSSSRRYLMPKPDSDVLRMTKLIPVMLSDLNYAAMFQCFSILYGIDIDDKNIEFAPNAFMRFKSDSESDKKPQLGQIKPQVDIDQVLGLIQSQLALWLNARGIRPGAVGKLDKDNFASGISKMIDEMDTVEIRQKLVQMMVEVEAEFWELLMHKLHPVWVRGGLLATQQLFTSGARVATIFGTQTPATDRAKLVGDQRAEREAGFTTRRRALEQLNPLFAEDELDTLEQELDADSANVSTPSTDPADPSTKAENVDTKPVAAGADPEAEKAAAAVAKTEPFNGAQVEGVLSVCEKVANGLITKDSAKAILSVAFGLADEWVNRIIDPIEVKEPAAPSAPFQKEQAS